MNLLSKKSVILSPMEGVTDDIYRYTMFKHFNDWDLFCTDFYRIPSEGRVTQKAVLNHFGDFTLCNTELKNKTVFQILCSARSNLESFLNTFKECDIPWLDLNLGCPSGKVNAHQGGAFLLKDLDLLKKIVAKIRKEHTKIFTAKIRVGFHDDKNFEEILKTLEGEGVELITVHARTRDQLYKGMANWDYIQRAVKLCKVPVVGNGDIWTPHDIEKIFNETGCHSVMCARGALKTPWLAYLYKNNIDNLKTISNHKNFLISQRKKFLPLYFKKLEEQYKQLGIEDSKILGRFKGLSRYIFDEFEAGPSLKSQALRAKNYSQFKSISQSQSL